jgi:hypothetical protein
MNTDKIRNCIGVHPCLIFCGRGGLLSLQSVHGQRAQEVQQIFSLLRQDVLALKILRVEVRIRLPAPSMISTASSSVCALPS